MRGALYIRRCNGYSGLRYRCGDIQKPFLFNLARGYASRRPPPGFGANPPSHPGARPFKAKPSSFESKKTPKAQPRGTVEESTDDVSEAKPPRRFRIRPGKIVLFSLAAFIGYKVYIWQIDPYRSVILNPQFFNPFILKARQKVSSTSSILSLLSVPKGQNTVNVAEAWKTGVWSVQVMQPELQIMRAYTPLPPADDTEPQVLRLFVRQEPQGEVSKFLHTINRGTLVHLRGPHVEYEMPQDVEEVLFIAAGTGIAPALQVAHTLYKHRTASSEDGPKMRILWANRRREDSYKRLEPSLPQQIQEGAVPKLLGLVDNWQGKPKIQRKDTEDKNPAPEVLLQTPLVEELEALKSKHPGNVAIDYFVDEESSYITESLLRKYLSHAASSGQSTNDGAMPKKIVLISGPEGFVNFYAGAKLMKGGKEVQGPLGGMLRRIDPNGWDVWKL